MKKILTIRLSDRHRHLIALIKENWLRLFFAMGFSLLISLSTAASAYLIKPAIDDVFFKNDTTMLMVIPVVVIFI